MNTSKSRDQFDDIDNLNRSFISQIAKLKSYLVLANCPMPTFKPGRPSIFKELQQAEKQRIINNLIIFNDICERTTSQGSQLSNSKQITWYAMQKLGLHFPSDLFEKIDDDDIVEIYNKDAIQVFRNFKFMELCSYSLEEILCQPWTRLFHRTASDDFDKLIGEVDNLLQGNVHNTIPLTHLGTQEIIELETENQRTFDLQLKFLAPLYTKNKQLFGYLNTCSARLSNKSKQTIKHDVLNFSSFLA